MLSRIRRFVLVTLVNGLGVVSVASATAQMPAPEVGLGFAVDTTLADVGPIVRLVRAYLAKPDSLVRSRALWETGPADDHTHDDLAARYALQGAAASVIGVSPTDDGDSVYVVKLLHARASRVNGPVSPIALERLYAVRTTRNSYGWQLAAALPRLTKVWRTESAGRIIFHYAPDQQPNVQRAERAAAFVDSVAALFDVRPPPRIDYYLTASPDEYFRAPGLDFFVSPSGPGQSTGGNALPDVGVMLSGDPSQGELYRHELVHVALGGGIRAGFINEGAAAWLGGSRRQSARELFRVLATFQQKHPEVTFGAIVRDKLSVPHAPAASSDAWYATGALACDAVFRRAGIAGLRALAKAPNDDSAFQVLSRLLSLPNDSDALDRWWRTAAANASRFEK